MTKLTISLRYKNYLEECRETCVKIQQYCEEEMKDASAQRGYHYLKHIGELIEEAGEPDDEEQVEVVS